MSDAAFVGACIGGVVGLLVVAFFFFTAFTRKPTDAVKEKPKKLRPVQTPLPYSEAINRLLAFAPTQNYKVEEVAPDGSRVILSTPVTFMSYGFFFPIYFWAAPDGGTLVEVGVVGRSYQRGPVITNGHEKAFRMVCQAVLPPQTQQPYPGQPYPPASPPYGGQPTTPTPTTNQPSQ